MGSFCSSINRVWMTSFSPINKKWRQVDGTGVSTGVSFVDGILKTYQTIN